jgi:hypothetical protein
MNNFLGEIMGYEDGSVTATMEIVPGLKVGATSPIGDVNDAMRKCNENVKRVQAVARKYGLGTALMFSGLSNEGKELFGS